MHRGASLISIAAATAFFGCGDDDGGSTTPDMGQPAADMGGTTTPPDMGGVADAGETVDMGTPAIENCTVNPAADVVRNPMCPMSADWFRFVRGTVESEGMTVADALPQVCVRNNAGSFLCLQPEASCADGSWAKEFIPDFRCISSVVMSVTKLSGGSYATTFCNIDTTGEGILDVATPLPLYTVEPAPNKPAFGDATAARMLTLQDDFQLEVTPGHIEGCFLDDTSCPNYDTLGVRRIQMTDATPCFLDATNTPDELFAFAGPGLDLVSFEPPNSMKVKRQFPFRVPNNLNLAAGATVDLFTLGSLTCETPEGMLIEEGDWEEYGTGTVSADGMFVEGELPCLTWFGYKAR